MRRLFLTIFLWFSLTLLVVALSLLVLFAHMGMKAGALLRITMHDATVFSVAGLIFCWFVSRYLTEPLQLSEAAAGIAEGRLETRVHPSLRKRHDEIAELARNFDVMAERIEALITGQRRLLGDVSHELRSPLSRLMVAVSLEPPNENLERISFEARRLDAMIGQILALTRIESGVDRGSPVPCDLTNLVHEIASDGDFEARARNRSVEIVQADAVTLTGFEELLRSAIENVVRNAIRHTVERTAVTISLESSASGARLRVRDHGPGVPEHLLAEIFVPFRRLASANIEGAGLGLAIAERAVQVHRGSIKASNAPDGGLVVEINLLLSAPQSSLN